MSTVVNLT